MADISQIRLPSGDTFDLIDEKSGYITAQYIENKTDYSIPVSRVGEIVVGETAIGTDSTNFPTSKAVVDYVDERVVQEIDAIDVGVTSVNGKTGSVTLSASDVGAITQSDLNNGLADEEDYILNQIPTSTSQLTNDSGFVKEYIATCSTYSQYKQLLSFDDSSVTIDDIKQKGVVLHIKYTTDIVPQTHIEFYKDSYSSSNCLGGTNHEDTITSIAGDVIDYVCFESSSTNYCYWYPTGLVSRKLSNIHLGTVESSGTGEIGNPKKVTVKTLLQYTPPIGTKVLLQFNEAYTSNNTTFYFKLNDYNYGNYAINSFPSQPANSCVLIEYTDEPDGTGCTLWKILSTSSDIPDWAKAVTKPTYTAEEVGALPSSTMIPTKTSELTNDSGFITSYTDEKVKQTAISSTDSFNYPLLLSSYIVGQGTKTGEAYKSDSLIFNAKNSLLTTSNIQIGGLRSPGSIKLGYLTISAVADTSTNTINFPNASGTIALTSDIPDTSSFLTSETDPVFSASPAAGISATDISNWNGKSSTDEKLKVTYNTSIGSFYPILTQTSGVAETKKQDSYFRFDRNNGNVELCIGGNGSINGILRLFTTTTGGWVQLSTQATGNRAIVLPNKNGTVALTSDIPKVYSSTNTNGYLTMATLPIYDGTVE